MEVYVIQEPIPTKGRSKGKKIHLPMTARHVRMDCITRFVGSGIHPNIPSEIRKRWKECYKRGFHCIKFKLIPV